MKKYLKINRKVNKKTVIMIGVLFFMNLILVSANDGSIKIDGEVRGDLKPKEVELKLENWMLNADLFQKMINKGEAYFEKEMELESWMLNPKSFEIKLQNNGQKNDSQNIEMEKEIELESWMLDVNEF